MLNPEQAEQVRAQILEQLSKFPEEQVKLLKEQVRHASPEQLEKFISSQEEGEEKCLFCEIAEGNVETVKVYEDAAIFVMMDISPANLGHLIILPKKHYQFIFQVPDEVLWDMLKTMKAIIPSMINLVKAKGFNILMSQGPAAEQRVNHFSINIIPRFDDDKIQFAWQRKSIITEQKQVAEELKKAMSKIKSEEKPVERQESTPIQEKQEVEEKPEEKKDLYESMFPKRMP